MIIKLDSQYVYISFDEQYIYSIDSKKIENRIISIDLNPNYIGYSIVDWKSSSEFKVIQSGVYSIKHLNDLDFNLKGKELVPIQKKEFIFQTKDSMKF